MKTWRSVLAAWLALTAVLPGHDPVNAAEPPVRIVITESSRMPAPLESLPFSASVVDEAVPGRQALGLDEYLAAVPGVYLQNRYNMAQDLRISIRGFGARANFGVRGIKILVDGIPQSLPDGQSQVDSIDAASIERIEIIRGPSSALYGNASGGVLDLRTTSDGSPRIGARATAGDFGYRAFRLHGNGNDNNWSGSATAGATRLDGYRQHSAGKSRVLNLKSRWKTRQGEWTLIANALDSPLAQDPGGLTGNEAAADPAQASSSNVLFDAGEEVAQKKFGISYEREFPGDQHLNVRAYGFDRDFANRLPFVSGGSVRLDRSLAGGGAQWTADATAAGLEHQFTIGLDLDQQDDDRRRYDNNQGVSGAETFSQKEKVTSLGLYAQDVLALSPNLSLTAGARIDSISFRVDDRFLADGDDSGGRDFEQFSPMLGVSWQPGQAINVYGNITTSYETPTTTELANPAGGGFNPLLKPQTATNYELGIRLKRSALALSTAIYHIKVTDELVPFELPQFPGRNFYRNAGRSTRDGLEAALVWRPNPSWRLTAAYNYSDYTFDAYTTPAGDLSGNRLPGIPKHVVAFETVFRHTRGWYASGDLRYVSAQFADDANTTSAGGYSLLNLRAGRELKTEKWKINLFGGINNATDRGYFDNIRLNAAAGRYFEPAPPRNFYAGLEIARQLP